MNQCGSLLYMRLLGVVKLTLLVPVVNALMFVVTLIVGYLVGEQIQRGVVIGSCLVVTGVSLCLATEI